MWLITASPVAMIRSRSPWTPVATTLPAHSPAATFNSIRLATKRRVPDRERADRGDLEAIGRRLGRNHADVNSDDDGGRLGARDPLPDLHRRDAAGRRHADPARTPQRAAGGHRHAPVAPRSLARRVD